MEHSPWKANSYSASQKLPALYGTLIFVTMFTTACHWSLSWVRCVQSTPCHPRSVRSVLILCSHLLLGLTSVPLRRSFQPIRPSLRSCEKFPYKLFFFITVTRLVPRPPPKLEDIPLSAVHDCLLNMFAATHHIWRPSPPLIKRGSAMPCRQGPTYYGSGFRITPLGGWTCTQTCVCLPRDSGQWRQNAHSSLCGLIYEAQHSIGIYLVNIIKMALR
jgi:hypothetical protein